MYMVFFHTYFHESNSITAILDTYAYFLERFRYAWRKYFTSILRRKHEMVK